jgi:BON domain
MRRVEFRLAAVFLCVSLATACNLMTSFQKPDDGVIVADIQSKLFQDPVLKTRSVQVVSQKGVVVLTGTVNTDLEKAAAERLAGEATGVKQVINQLELASAPGATSPPRQAEMNAANQVPKAPPVREKPSTVKRQTADTTPPPMAAKNEPVTPAPSKVQRADTTYAPPPPPPAPPEPERITIPAGTEVSIRMIDDIDSSRDHAGDEFAATIASAVVVGDRVVIPKGSDARVRLLQVASAGHMTGRSEVHIELVEVSVYGEAYNVRSSAYSQTGASRGKRTAETVGGGAAVGALIGAIAGKGKGAAIGAGVGAAAGTGVQAATKGEQIKIPSETKIDFTLKSAVTVTM